MNVKILTVTHKDESEYWNYDVQGDDGSHRKCSTNTIPGLKVGDNLDVNFVPNVKRPEEFYINKTKASKGQFVHKIPAARDTEIGLSAELGIKEYEIKNKDLKRLTDIDPVDLAKKWLKFIKESK